MRLVCLHADTVDALKRLNIEFDDLTPDGLWSSKYHLVGLTPDQVDALEVFQVESEDVTPAQLIQAVGTASQTSTRAERRPAQGARGAEPRPVAAASPDAPVASAGAAAIAGTVDQTGREQLRSTTGAEAEVPLSQARDGGSRVAETKTEAKAEGRAAAGQAAAGQTPRAPAANAPAVQPAATQKNAGAKGGAVTGPQPAQAGRKGQQPLPAASGGQRYGTTRLRISVAGKYTEATVANGKIVVGGRTFDSPDQAAAELTKSRGDWTFWEYYDSADGKWRMLTRDWDTVLKSAAPGGR